MGKVTTPCRAHCLSFSKKRWPFLSLVTQGNRDLCIFPLYWCKESNNTISTLSILTCSPYDKRQFLSRFRDITHGFPKVLSLPPSQKTQLLHPYRCLKSWLHRQHSCTSHAIIHPRPFIRIHQNSEPNDSGHFSPTPTVHICQGKTQSSRGRNQTSSEENSLCHDSSASSAISHFEAVLHHRVGNTRDNRAAWSILFEQDSIFFKD